MTQVFILSIKDAELVTEEYCRTNFPNRMLRAERFRFREDKLRCIGAGVLLSRVLGLKESDICCNEFGKPYCNKRSDGHSSDGHSSDGHRSEVLPGEWNDFSLSHSGNYIVLAVSDKTVGADIEDMSRDHTDIAKRVFLPEEITWMRDVVNMRRRFYILWTLKESVMKAEGKGLSMDPGSFSVLRAAECSAFGKIMGKTEENTGEKTTGKTAGKIVAEGRVYYGESFEYDGHIISVCSQSSEPAVCTLITSEMLY